ncbi:hypothetical protein SIN8267_02062 [Sinobacterium norvegicum]|uniref:HTH araC/xylS-type domain-containing protein n=1 Tax=Sinobacterium norvegicum TaxID=1641715 RepID=A0ABM9AFN4_9GAMM|nr:AraC family transcriptional regulator [Sinobacterium norvegicum]CAH0991947.1 hypothetical protein SIN8267_02062 [Sinobacterium norvegicum]
MDSDELEKKIVPLARADIALDIITILRQMGEDVYGMVEEAEFPLSVLERQHTVISEEAWHLLLAVIGRRIGISGFSTLSKIFCNEVYIPRFIDGGQGCLTQVLEEVLDISNSLSVYQRVKLRQLAGHVWLVQEKKYVNSETQVYAEQLVVTFLIELIRILSDNNRWNPGAISMQCSDVSDSFSSFFSGSKIFCSRSVTAIQIPTDLVMANVTLLGSREWLIDRARIRTEGFVANFRLALKPFVGAGRFSIKQAAPLVGLSVRSLQRKLDAEGVSYSTIVEELLREQMKMQVGETERTFTEISMLMGYSDGAHFSRAFKKLMGLTPKQYRAQQH